MTASDRNAAAAILLGAWYDAATEETRRDFRNHVGMFGSTCVMGKPGRYVLPYAPADITFSSRDAAAEAASLAVVSPSYRAEIIARRSARRGGR